MTRPHLLLVLALAAALAGCGEKHYYSVDLNGTATPVDKDGVPLPGAAAPNSNPHAGMPDPTVMPAAAPAPPARGPLAGNLELDPALGVDASKFKRIFIVARRAGDMTMDGMLPLDPKLPASFVLGGTGQHGGGLSDGPHLLTARLDSDGDAMPSPGDVEGVLQDIVPGGPPVTLRLDHVLTADDIARESAQRRPAGGAAPMAAGGAAPFAPFAGGGAQTPEDLAGPRFSGTIELPASHANLNGKYRLFLYLRNPQNEGGMPLAVKAFDNASFPLSFDVGTENIALDVENKSEMISGKVKVMARLSVSGALKGGPGDLEVTPVLTPPAKDLHLVLDQVRTQ